MWDVVAGVDLNVVGYAIVGLFVADLGGRPRGVALRPRRGALVGGPAGALGAPCRAPRRRPRSPFRDLEEVAAAVRKAGGRLSAPRRRVLEAPFAAEGPVPPAPPRRGLHGRGPEVDLASVYRNLDEAPRSSASSATSTSATARGSTRSSGAGEREILVCERCDRVTTVAPAQLDEVRAARRADLRLSRALHPLPHHRPVPRVRGGGRRARGSASTPTSTATATTSTLTPTPTPTGAGTATDPPRH